MKCSSCSQVVRPVVALDIDGTLGDHHGHFQEFAEAYVGRRLGPDPVSRYVSMHREAYNYEEEFSDWLGLDKPLYRDVKLAYRQGGMKRLMPIHDGARHLTEQLHRYGAEVWLCTTRPYLRLDNIDPDTREWARRNSIRYDGLIYGEDKYERLANIIEPDRIVAVLDDLPEMFDAAESVGLPVIQKVNGHTGTALRDPFRSTLPEVEPELVGRVLAWHARHETKTREETAHA